MSIVYPITAPTNIAPRTVDITPEVIVAKSESIYTFAQQVYLQQGARWRLKANLPPMNRADAEEWIAFALKLRGSYGTFTYAIPAQSTARGSASGTPLVDGINAVRSTEISTKGWLSAASNVLRAGDLISISSRIYKVLDDVSADISGEATFEIWPPLRTAAADNTTITTSSPAGTWRLLDQPINWTIGEAEIYGLGFEAVEAL